MSFEPDTNDIRLRQLKEEIAKIREENFARAFPTNNVTSAGNFNSDTGTPNPFIGVTSTIPAVIRVTEDTGVIDLLDYDNKNVNKDFLIGDIITGDISGATAEIGDIDASTDTTGTLTLVPSSITGTFTDGETLDTGSENNVAEADGIEYTQTGRGHLKAGAGSIIAQDDNVPREIHFIDGAEQDGQVIYLRAQNGQTIKLKRPTTTDATTGNIDTDESFDIIENAIIILQYQKASNATPTGGWVPLISNVSVTPSGDINLPLYYDIDDKGDLNGLTSVAIDLSVNTAHATKMRLIEDTNNPGVPISQTVGISGSPPSQAVLFFLTVEQDSNGGHTIVLPATVDPVPTIDTNPDAISTILLWTDNNGISYQSMRVIEGAGGNQTPWLQDVDANTFDLFRIDKLRFFGAGGFSFPTDNSIQGISTAGAGLQFNVPLSQSYRFFVGGDDVGGGGGEFLTIQAGGAEPGFDFHDKNLNRVGSIQFTDFPSNSFNSFIFPFGNQSELQYIVQGVGSHHSFFAENDLNAVFEMRKDVNKSNVNFDVVTNDIINIDQAQFDGNGGFGKFTDFNERRITGGAEGIVMNIPKITPFAGGFHIYFENNAETESEKEYSFEKGQFRMFGNEISDTLGIFFSNGGSIADLNSHIQFNGGVNSNAIDPQTIKWGVKDSGFTTIDMFEITGTEHNTTNAGGFKLFTDLNFQTQDAVNVDRLHFNSNNGIVGGDQVAIAGFGNDMQFNVPNGQQFSFKDNDEEIASLDNVRFHMLTNSNIINPSIISDGSFILGLTHTLGETNIIDGEFRLNFNAGTGFQDVIVGTGDGVVNLSNVLGQTPWQTDIDANTFMLFNLDTLRYTKAGETGHDGIIGFGEYGSAVDPSGQLKWSVPSGESYEWQHDLDPIATMNTASFVMKSNSSITHPSIITEGSFILGVTHTSGTSGMFDGESRLVSGVSGGDVIFRSGGTDVNLTTLGAGGGDNLGNHLATQSLDMNSGVDNNPIINFELWTNSFNQSWIAGNSGLSWFIPSGDDYFFNIANQTQLRVNLGEVQIFNNVLSWESSNDFIVNDGSGFILNSEASTDEFIFKSGGIDRFLVDNSKVDLFEKPLSNFIGWTAGIGQGLTVSGSGLLWDIDSSDSYEFRVGGSNVFSVTGVGSAFNGGSLGMSSNKIINVLDPTDAQDVATKAYVDLQAGGGATDQWSTFPAVSNVDMDNFQIVDVTAITGIANGGGLVWSVPGISLLGSSSGFQFNVGSSDTSEFRFGGVARVAFSNTGSSFSGGNMNLNSNKIVNVLDPTALQDVATKAYVDAQVGGGGSFVTTNTSQSGLSGDKGWTGIHEFTGSVLLSGTTTAVGNSSGDTVFFNARVGTDFLPNSNNSRDLGSSGLQWRNLFIDGTAFIDILSMGGNIAMSGFKITNHGTPSASTDVATKGYVDSQTGGGGNFITLDTFQSVSASKTWNGSSHRFTAGLRVDGTMEMNGTLNHDGSAVGFYGVSPTSRQSSSIAQLTSPVISTANIFELAQKLNGLIADLDDTGIIRAV